MKRNLLDLDANGLAGFFEELGEKPFRARQVLKWVHQQGADDFAAMSDLAKGLREKLSGVARIHAPTIVGDRPRHCDAMQLFGDILRHASRARLASSTSPCCIRVFIR